MSPTHARALPIWGFLVLVVVDVVILQGVGWLLVPADAEYGVFPDVASLRSAILVPVGLSVLLGVAATTWLGWWKPVLHDDRPVQRWVRVVPVAILLVALLGADYGNLLDQEPTLVLALVVGALLVGVGEELMFRGIGVVAFRRAGLTEGKVALWSSLVFGAVHLSNVVVEGPGAFMQAVLVSFTGYLLYLTRRSTGTLVVPMALHAAYDFSLFSSNLGGDGDGNTLAAGLVLLMNVVLLVTLLVRRRHIEPEGSAEAATA